MLYRQNLEPCFSPNAGHGVTRHDLEALLKRLAPALQQLQQRQFPGATPILGIASRRDDLAALETLAANIRRRFRHIVVAGTGGSGLSGRTLLQLVPMGTLPSFYFMENIDPDMMDETLASIDLEQTCFIVISKSGSTVETLSQYYVLLEYVTGKRGKEKAREHFVIITVPADSPLRASAQAHGLTILDHPADIGGRYSILTLVGLLPAAIAGLDIARFRRGAQEVVAQMDSAAHPADCPAAEGAALQYAFMHKRHPMSVLLPYAERLTGFAMWYRQCWAESLGKQGKGSTPIPAVGTTDQHSQLQLYLDGPRDKLFTMIMLQRAGTGQRIAAPQREDLTYIRGKTMGDVMAAEQQATLDSLVKNGCPVRVMQLDTLREEQMGALLMHFMLEIMLTSALMEINPFDQPAVEEGKILARNYLLKGTA